MVAPVAARAGLRLSVNLPDAAAGPRLPAPATGTAPLALSLDTRLPLSRVVVRAGAGAGHGPLAVPDDAGTSGPAAAPVDSGSPRALVHAPVPDQAAASGQYLMPTGHLGSGRGPVSGPQAATVPTRPRGAGWAEKLLAVTVNGTPQDEPTLFLASPDARLYAPAEAFATWRLPAPQGVPHTHRGQPYLPLARSRVRLDESAQTIALDANAARAPLTRLGENPLAAPASAVLPGAFLNYDVQASRGDGHKALAGLFQLGLFGPPGIGGSGFLAQSGHGLTRLETRLERDDPSRMRTLSLGDALTRPGLLGRPVRFGGVAWGTNFALRPDFIPFPLPTVAGIAALPSTAEVYVNNALTRQADLPYGPFEVTNIPALNGAGEVTVQVRDLLGRRQTFSQPFYVSPTLLRPGLADFSLEAGALREDFGRVSNRYGRAFAAATRRQGVTPALALETRLELSRATQTALVSAHLVRAPFGGMSLGFGGSHGGDDDPAGGAPHGGLARLGFEHLGRRFTVVAQGEWAGAGYRDLAGATPASNTQVLSAGFSPRAGDRLGVAYVGQRPRSGPSVRLLSLNYALALPRPWFASLYALHDLASNADTRVGILISHALGDDTSVSANVSNQQGDSYLNVQRNLPAGSGVGWRALAGERRLEAGVAVQNGGGRLSADAGRFAGAQTLRLGAAGSVVWAERLFFARILGESFAVVRAGDFPHVTVLAENQPVAETDARGRAFLPELRAFERNSLRIDPDDLPLDAEVAGLEVTAVPVRGGAARVEFPVRAVRAALVGLRASDGSPLPPGAYVLVNGGSERFPVALNGEAYVRGLAADNRLEAIWDERRCVLRVRLPAGAGPQPRLGPYRCDGFTA